MDFPDSLKDYIKRIGKTRLLTPKEEKLLAARVKGGDRAAHARMIEANLRLVVAISRRYWGKGLPPEDLISEGNIGLMIAVERYDPEQGRFSTYATYWIRQSMGRAIFNTAGLVRLPVHVAAQRSKLYRRRQTLTERGAKSDAATLARETDLSVEEVDRLLGMEQFGLSLDRECGDDRSLYELVADGSPTPFDAAETSQRAAHIRGWLAGLKEKERIVIERRFGFDGTGEKTLEETAQGLNVTRERVRQIEGNALKKLKKTARRMNAWRS